MKYKYKCPDALFNKLNEEFDFDFDLCASGGNYKCDDWTDDIVSFVGSEESKDHTNLWMNPPYSRGNIDTCMEQAYRLHKGGKTVVCLVRFDPSTKWFQEWVHGRATNVLMLDKRVRFKGASDSYNFPCCVVIYSKSYGLTTTEYSLWGWE